MGKSILIVDDEPVIRKLLATVFGAANWQVQTAPDVPSARAMNREGGFDVVLTDVNMPGESGCDLVHWIAENCPRTRTILMSTEQTSCENCPLLARRPFLHKPFSVAHAVALVNQLASAPPS